MRKAHFCSQAQPAGISLFFDWPQPNVALRQMRRFLAQISTSQTLETLQSDKFLQPYLTDYCPIIANKPWTANVNIILTRKPELVKSIKKRGACKLACHCVTLGAGRHRTMPTRLLPAHRPRATPTAALPPSLRV